MQPDYLVALEQLIAGGLAQAVEKDAFGADLEIVLADLEQTDAASALESMVPVVELLTKHRQELSELPEDFDEVLRPIRDAAEVLTQVRTRDELQKCHLEVRDISNGKEELQRLVRRGLQQLARLKFKASLDLAIMLEKLPLPSDTYSTLGRAASEGLAIGNRDVTDPELANDFEEAETGLASAREQLRQAGLEEHVVSFLLKAAAGEAHLGMVSTELIQWADGAGVLGMFSISVTTDE